MNSPEYSNKISILGLSKAEVLAALYNSAVPIGLGVLSSVDSIMTTEQAERELEKTTYFDYLYGRPLKVQLSGDQINPVGYDSKYGEGACKKVIDALRAVESTELNLSTIAIASDREPNILELKINDEKVLSAIPVISSTLRSITPGCEIPKSLMRSLDVGMFDGVEKVYRELNDNELPVAAFDQLAGNRFLVCKTKQVAAKLDELYHQGWALNLQWYAIEIDKVEAAENKFM